MTAGSGPWPTRPWPRPTGCCAPAARPPSCAPPGRPPACAPPRPPWAGGWCWTARSTARAFRWWPWPGAGLAGRTLAPDGEAEVLAGEVQGEELGLEPEPPGPVGQPQEPVPAGSGGRRLLDHAAGQDHAAVAGLGDGVEHGQVAAVGVQGDQQVVAAAEPRPEPGAAPRHPVVVAQAHPPAAGRVAVARGQG